jgi:hypothetical protein
MAALVGHEAFVKAVKKHFTLYHPTGAAGADFAKLQEDQKGQQKVDPGYPGTASKDKYEPARNPEDPREEYALQMIREGYFNEDATYARFLQTLGKNPNSPHWIAAEQGEGKNGQEDKG